MIATLLGTGTSQGVPVPTCDCAVCRSDDPCDKRLRASLHIETETLSLVIDTGPDFRQQVLRAGVRRLDAVLFTHQHKDHTAGLDDIRGFNFRQHISVPLYGRAAVLEQIRTEFAYIFDPVHRHEGLPRATLHPIDGTPLELHGVHIQPLEAMHYRLPVFGFRISGLSYLTDANHIEPETRDLMRGSDVLVLDALRQTPHPAHFTLEQAVEVAKDIGASQTYFTHISHMMGRHVDVNASLPDGMALAYDGLQLRL